MPDRKTPTDRETTSTNDFSPGLWKRLRTTAWGIVTEALVPKPDREDLVHDMAASALFRPANKRRAEMCRVFQQYVARRMGLSSREKVPSRLDALEALSQTCHRRQIAADHDNAVLGPWCRKSRRGGLGQLDGSGMIVGRASLWQGSKARAMPEVEHHDRWFAIENGSCPWCSRSGEGTFGEDSGRCSCGFSYS